jgi:hypothetical protein
MLKTGRLSIVSSVFIASFALCSFAGMALAQSQSDNAPSVAEAARRAREQKKNSAKPNRTLTNDDIPPAPAGSSNTAGSQNSNGVTQPAASSAEAPATSAAPPAANAETTDAVKSSENQTADQKKAANAAALERAKKELAQALSELDVMQRKNVLDSDSYYSKTDFASDKGGKANLDAEQTQISSKKEAVEKIKARVMELQELLGEPVTGEPDKTPDPH